MKTILFLIIPLFALFFISCTETPSEPEEEENKKRSTNYISEVYFMHGTIIDRDPDCFPCTVEFEYTYDTTRVTSAVSIKYLEENPDSVQFFGLEGANSGRKAAFPPNCRESEVLYDLCVYAAYDNNSLTLDLFRTGYLYEGYGTLGNGELSVNGLYKYRGDSLGYDLSGQKVEGFGGLDEPEFFKTGLYFVRGEKITTKYSAWPIPGEEEPVIDTVRVEFTTHLKVQDDEETIRFVGLPGADAGINENRVYSDCTVSEDCMVFGQSTGMDSFEMDIENNGRTYIGTGIARTSDFELNSEYQYQNTTIRYNLAGQRYVE